MLNRNTLLQQIFQLLRNLLGLFNSTDVEKLYKNLPLKYSYHLCQQTSCPELGAISAICVHKSDFVRLLAEINCRIFRMPLRATCQECYYHCSGNIEMITQYLSMVSMIWTYLFILRFRMKGLESPVGICYGDSRVNWNDGIVITC